MNIVDIIVILALISSLFRGSQIGLVRQLGSTVGFITGLMLSIPLGQWVAGLGSDDPTLKMLLSTLTLIIVSFSLMSIGEFVGLRLKTRMTTGKIVDHIDNATGSAMAALTFGLGLWFATAFISLLPPSSIQLLARQSYTFNVIDRNLPPASQALASLNHLIDPNNTPLVFSGREPSPNANRELPALTNYQSVLATVSPSVVRIQGIGCGGVVNGSGWVLSPNRVVTNAHVVAGVANPKVYDSNGTHDAEVVHFDAAYDIAVLSVGDLAGKPLPLRKTPVEINSTALIIGFPGGGEQQAQTGIILDRVDALGRDIYGQAKTIRNVYIMQTTVIPGNSGGPIFDEAGSVIGVVFGTSTTYNNVGYGLTIAQLIDALESAKTTTEALSTGKCSEM